MKRISLLITIIIIFSFNIISPQSNIKTVNKLARKCIKGHAKSCEKLNNIAMTDAWGIVRIAAAQALGKAGDPRAVEPLIKASTVDSLINPWVINVLLDMQVTDPEAIELYIRSLNLDRDDLRLKVANIILNSNDPKAVKARPQARQVIASLIHITEIVNYDNYGRAASSVLKNTEGQEIAEKIFIFNQYNPTQKSGEIISDLTTGNEFHSEVYDEYGRPKNPMWLCLDKKGNIIRRSGKPVLVKPFDAQQKSEFKNVYDGAFIDKRITKIYPCKNCAGHTGEKNCKYVW